MPDPQQASPPPLLFLVGALEAVADRYRSEGKVVQSNIASRALGMIEAIAMMDAES